MTCAQGLLRLLWGGARSWSAMGLSVYMYMTSHFRSMLQLGGGNFLTLHFCCNSMAINMFRVAKSEINGSLKNIF